MGTASASSTALSSLHAPGPNGQATVLPLSKVLVREAPRSTVRCLFDDCRLIQYMTHDRHCRKCHRPLDPPVDPLPTEPLTPEIPVQSRSRLRRSTSVIITTTDELAVTVAGASALPAVCPALARFDQCLPVVLGWLRAQTGLSQKQIAQCTGVTRTAVNAFECGRVMPSVATVKKLAAAMDTTMPRMMRMCEYLRDGH